MSRLERPQNIPNNGMPHTSQSCELFIFTGALLLSTDYQEHTSYEIDVFSLLWQARV